MRARRPKREAGADPPDAASAMEIAVRFLGTRPRTRHELAQRLRRSNVPDPVAEATLERLAELGYVDDAAFARWWAEQRDRHAPRGRRMLEAELRQHGVPRDVIDDHRDEHAAPVRAPEDAALPGSEAERAREALDRHLHGRPLPTDRKALQRLGVFLMRRGFDPETVRAALRSAMDRNDEVQAPGDEVGDPW
jgi:regulatory protein